MWGKPDGHIARECRPARAATWHVASVDYKVPQSDPVLGSRGLGMRSVGPDAKDGAARARDVALWRRFNSTYPGLTEFISRFCN
jgi:hypothetical protein